MRTFLMIVSAELKLLLLVALTGLLGAFPALLCWNIFMPAVFELPTITFWQGFALTALCSMLFGRCGSSGKN